MQQEYPQAVSAIRCESVEWLESAILPPPKRPFLDSRTQWRIGHSLDEPSKKQLLTLVIIQQRVDIVFHLSDAAGALDERRERRPKSLAIEIVERLAPPLGKGTLFVAEPAAAPSHRRVDSWLMRKVRPKGAVRHSHDSSTADECSAIHLYDATDELVYAQGLNSTFALLEAWMGPL